MIFTLRYHTLPPCATTPHTFRGINKFQLRFPGKKEEKLFTYPTASPFFSHVRCSCNIERHISLCLPAHQRDKAAHCSHMGRGAGQMMRRQAIWACWLDIGCTYVSCVDEDACRFKKIVLRCTMEIISRHADNIESKECIDHHMKFY